MRVQSQVVYRCLRAWCIFNTDEGLRIRLHPDGSVGSVILILVNSIRSIKLLLLCRISKHTKHNVSGGSQQTEVWNEAPRCETDVQLRWRRKVSVGRRGWPLQWPVCRFPKGESCRSGFFHACDTPLKVRQTFLGDDFIPKIPARSRDPTW